ncbi:DUF4262 domain-containing protein [Allorhizocola rhizosphaerae]|uniref:DUF4262 domain-containing protein n=1 Tax=Allorhizocola rhizosphaerae TaxID=1872709 RepID=UPI0013C2FED8|nr:DUF4262 domain-containing protein [Allorhizocola rhizosphaerae]
MFDIRVVREPGWAYSWGLWQAYGHPEIAIFGLPADRWGLVNVVADLVASGLRLAPGVEIDDVLVGSRVAVRRIDPSWCARLFPLPGEREFLQVVWPDADGAFPWEGEGDLQAQPRLWLPVDDHPPGPWTTTLVAGSFADLPPQAFKHPR